METCNSYFSTQSIESPTVGGEMFTMCFNALAMYGLLVVIGMISQTPDVHKVAWDLLKGADGILVPGEFGDRGVQGKILAARYARQNRIPFLGIRLGIQIAIIEYAQTVLHLPNANSTRSLILNLQILVLYLCQRS